MSTTQATSSDIFADIAGTLDAAEANASTDWEMEFVASLIERYDQYGESMFLSDRQAEILSKLAREARWATTPNQRSASATAMPAGPMLLASPLMGGSGASLVCAGLASRR